MREAAHGLRKRFTDAASHVTTRAYDSENVVVSRAEVHLGGKSRALEGRDHASDGVFKSGPAIEIGIPETLQ
jgi:hypothetical protein